MRSRLAVALTIAVLFGAVLSRAVGAMEAQQPSALWAQVLSPDPRSDSGLTRVQVTFLSDGTKQLGISYGSGLKREVFIYWVMADSPNATYRAFRVQGNPFRDGRVREFLQLLRPRLEASGQWRRYERLLEAAARGTETTTVQSLQASLDTQEPPPICTSCQAICSGNGFSRAITWDPVYIDLTHTDLSLNWGRQDSPRGCVWYARGSNGCWAAQPSPAGTNWYVDSCGMSAVDKSEMYAAATAYGGFHNDDFLDPRQRTWVRNDALVRFDAGIVAHGFQFYATGEAHELLDATVAGSHYNNCY